MSFSFSVIGPTRVIVSPWTAFPMAGPGHGGLRLCITCNEDKATIHVAAMAVSTANFEAPMLLVTRRVDTVDAVSAIGRGPM